MTGILIVRSTLNYDEKEKKERKKNFDSFSVSFFLSSYFCRFEFKLYNKMLNEFEIRMIKYPPVFYTIFSAVRFFFHSSFYTFAWSVVRRENNA